MHNPMGGKNIRAVIAIAGVFLGAARGQAGAWGNTWMGTALEQAVNSTISKAGPFRYSVALQVADAGYDSDIFFGTLSRPVPDWTFSAGPDLRAYLPLKRVVFEVSDSLRYLFYLKTENWRTLNNAFAGAAHVVFDKLYFRAGGGLINAQEHLSSEVPANIRLNEEDLSGLAFWQASRGSGLSLQYQISRYNYENLTPEFPDIRQNLDRTESVCDLTAYLRQQSIARFFLRGEYGSYVFQDIAASYKDSRSYGGFGGVEFQPPASTGFEGLTAGIRGSLELGYEYLDFLNPLLRDYSGLSGNIAVSMGIMKRTALRLFFSMGPQFSAYSGLTYYVQTAYGVGLSRSLARHVLFTYDFGYGRNDYPKGKTIFGNPAIQSDTEYTSHSFNLDFQLRRDLKVTLLTNISRRDFLLDDRAANSRVFIGFSLTYGSPATGMSLPVGGISMPAGPVY